MERNVGGTDRMIRIAIGVMLILIGGMGYLGRLRVATGISAQAITSLLLVMVGIVLLWTAAICRCPINAMLGFDTVKSEEECPPGVDDIAGEDKAEDGTDADEDDDKPVRTA